MTHSPNVVVRVTTDEEIMGYGEASTWHVVYGYDQQSVVQAIERYLGPAVIGTDPLDIEGIVSRMDFVLPKNRMAKAGIETACQDVRGKAAGLPLVRLLGGGNPEAVEVIAAVDIVPPSEAETLTRLWVEKGFGCIKIKVGLDVLEDVERVRVVRETAGPGMRLRVDGNQGYDRASAMKACKAFEAFDLQWIEQPLPEWDFEGMAALARNFSTPIAVDESIAGLHDVYRVASNGCCGRNQHKDREMRRHHQLAEDCPCCGSSRLALLSRRLYRDRGGHCCGPSFWGVLPQPGSCHRNPRK